MKFGAIIPTLNEFRLIPAVAGQLLKICDRVLILRGTRPNSGISVALTPVPQLDPRIEIIENAWPSEHETRNAGIEILTAGPNPCDYVFTVDSDEIFTVEALRMLQVGCFRGYRVVSCRFYTYWKDCDHIVDPPENLIAPVVVRADTRFTDRRLINGENTVINRLLMHHLSYVRTDAEVQEKLATFSHSHEIIPGWYENVWKKWDTDQGLENLHPTHPEAYKRAIRVQSNELKRILIEHGVTP